MDKSTIDKLLALPLNPVDDMAFSESDRQFVDWLYYSIVGSHVRECSCRNRYCDAYYEIVSLNKEIREIIKMKSNQRKYRLIPGYIVYYEGNHYSGANITDEIAEEYLKRHPDSAYMFEITEDDPKVDEAQKFLEESKNELKDAQPKLKDESVEQIVACQNTLRECIEGGDVENIISASIGLKAAWENAEAKPVENGQDFKGDGPAEDPENEEGQDSEDEASKENEGDSAQEETQQKAAKKKSKA